MSQRQSTQKSVPPNILNSRTRFFRTFESPFVKAGRKKFPFFVPFLGYFNQFDGNATSYDEALNY